MPGLEPSNTGLFPSRAGLFPARGCGQSICERMESANDTVAVVTFPEFADGYFYPFPFPPQVCTDISGNTIVFEPANSANTQIFVWEYEVGLTVYRLSVHCRPPVRALNFDGFMGVRVWVSYYAGFPLPKQEFSDLYTEGYEWEGWSPAGSVRQGLHSFPDLGQDFTKTDCHPDGVDHGPAIYEITGLLT